MSYQVSDKTITVLKELYKDAEFKPLKNKKQVYEIIYTLAFMAGTGSLAKKEGDVKAQDVLNAINEVGEEINSHINDLDLDYINSKMMK